MGREETEELRLHQVAIKRSQRVLRSTVSNSFLDFFRRRRNRRRQALCNHCYYRFLSEALREPSYDLSTFRVPVQTLWAWCRFRCTVVGSEQMDLEGKMG